MGILNPDPELYSTTFVAVLQISIGGVSGASNSAMAQWIVRISSTSTNN